MMYKTGAGKITEPPKVANKKVRKQGAQPVTKPKTKSTDTAQPASTS